MSTTERTNVLIELDSRRRTDLGKIGRHQRYLVTEEEDGTLIWTPAVVMSEAEARLRANPELLARIEYELAHPELDASDRPRRKR
ncbi:MAG TPA: hypothetical protein VIW24_24960 [Aldersonia sp.]